MFLPQTHAPLRTTAPPTRAFQRPYSGCHKVFSVLKKEPGLKTYPARMKTRKTLLIGGHYDTLADILFLETKEIRFSH